MMRSRTNNAPNPKNCSGRLPHLSIRKKAAMYPGMRPVQIGIVFRAATLRSCSQTVLCGCLGKIPLRKVLLFRAKP